MMSYWNFWGKLLNNCGLYSKKQCQVFLKNLVSHLSKQALKLHNCQSKTTKDGLNASHLLGILVYFQLNMSSKSSKRQQLYLQVSSEQKVAKTAQKQPESGSRAAQKQPKSGPEAALGNLSCLEPTCIKISSIFTKFCVTKNYTLGIFYSFSRMSSSFFLNKKIVFINFDLAVIYSTFTP